MLSWKKRFAPRWDRCDRIRVMTSTLLRLFLVGIVCGFAGFPVLALAETEVVKKWIEGQSNIKSLTADFTQERRSREGRRPVVSKGKFSFAAPGSFRWQMGEPAVTLAVQQAAGDLVVANVKRKKATVYPVALLKAEEAAMGFSFIEAGFPKTLAAFEKNFTVSGIETKAGVHHVTVTINDRRTSVALRKMIFYVVEGSYDLRGFYLRFRDSSSITTLFKNVKKNAAVAAADFKVDLSGYETTVSKGK